MLLLLIYGIKFLGVDENVSKKEKEYRTILNEHDISFFIFKGGFHIRNFDMIFHRQKGNDIYYSQVNLLII